MGGIVQLVMFEMAWETYAIELELVQEVIRPPVISRVPQTPGYIEGVINLRGYFLPVVDLRKRFRLGEVEQTKSARIMIIETEEYVLGITVDRVLEVVSVDIEDIEPPSPLIKGTIKSDLITGFTEIDERLVKVLDFDSVFSRGELEAMRRLERDETDSERDAED